MKILVSPGFGAGWSTWNSGDVARYMLTYQPIIQFLEAGGQFERHDSHSDKVHPLLEQLIADVKNKFGKDYVCVLGADDLVVVEPRGKFFISEYDGSETVEESDEIDWISP